VLKNSARDRRIANLECGDLSPLWTHDEFSSGFWNSLWPDLKAATSRRTPK